MLTSAERQELLDNFQKMFDTIKQDKNLYCLVVSELLRGLTLYNDHHLEFHAAKTLATFNLLAKRGFGDVQDD